MADLRPAPGYFLDAIVATSTAQQLARSCPEVSVDPVVISRSTGEVLGQLEADGFDVNQSDMGMLDASADIKSRQDAFLAKHSLADGASTEAVCAAAKLEIADETLIGSYLVEVAQ
ncbi:DUF5333 family protein [Aestuariivita boseongensis]|uniref:DUF5333 family protein n=1 Tax=Aestuariivita boseongensis TaxID=1470562 RepID=UPI00155D9B12|nr:DUF5333 family protein [Aestuariivita boseongensis]